MLTILIRHTKGRKELLKRCINSIIHSGGNADIVVSYDYEMNSEDMYSVAVGPYKELSYIRWVRVWKMPEPYHYNTYCNDLMKYVPPKSWYMFVDDDDMVLPESLRNLQKVVNSLDPQTPVIVQFKRGTKLKPSDDAMDNAVIQSGKIGMPCIVLNQELNHGVEFTSTGNADYLFIKEIIEKHKAFFIKLPIVYCDRRSHGLTITKTNG